MLKLSSVQNYRLYHSFELVTFFLIKLTACKLNILNILLVLKTVDYTSILFLYAFDCTGLGLGLTVLWSH